MEHYLEAQQVIKQNLANARMVYFTFDLWRSQNHQAFLGIVGSWVWADGKLHGTLLGLRWFHRSHTDINQAEHFWELIKFYELETKIGYFTVDNASNKDRAVTDLTKQGKFYMTNSY